MKRCSSLVCIFVMTAFSTAVLSDQTDLCGKQSTSVEFALDTSSSMGETYSVYSIAGTNGSIRQNSKLDYALRFIRMASEKIPPSEVLVSGVHSFLPSTLLIKDEKRTGEAFIKAISDMKVSVSSRTENSLDKRSLDYFARKRSKSTTLFLITDGDIDKGAHDPFEVLQTFYQNNPKSCAHIVSLAQTESEKAMISRLRQANVCSTIVALEDMSVDQNKFNALLESTVYRDCSSSDKLEFAGIPFVKQSVNLDRQAITVIDQLLEVIVTRSADEPIRILGWTDSVGDAAFNRTISLQRAQAVKDYLSLKGVENSRMTAIGAGESDKFDNSSENGRKRNRRVDIILGQ